LEFIADCIDLNVDIKEEDNLKEDLEIDDLIMIGLIIEIEKEFGIEIPAKDTKKLILAKDIVDYLIFKGIQLT